jgi:hypothetical protein
MGVVVLGPACFLFFKCRQVEEACAGMYAGVVAVPVGPRYPILLRSLISTPTKDPWELLRGYSERWV